VVTPKVSNRPIYVDMLTHEHDIVPRIDFLKSCLTYHGYVSVQWLSCRIHVITEIILPVDLLRLKKVHIAECSTPYTPNISFGFTRLIGIIYIRNGDVKDNIAMSIQTSSSKSSTRSEPTAGIATVPRKQLSVSWAPCDLINRPCESLKI
jgi:hypothetical protein